MSQSNLYIIGEIFLALVGGASYLFYYLNNLNDQLLHNNDSLRKKIEDEKRHTTGLKVKIQEQKQVIEDLQQQIKNIIESNQSNEVQYKKFQKENEKLQSSVESLESKLNNADQKYATLKNKLDLANQAIEDLQSQQINNNAESKLDFEEMYHDLKNSVAYNMSGGEQVLDVLRNRLLENGNFDDGEKLAELKQHYNSLGGMVGAVDGNQLFTEKMNEENKVDPEVDKIKDAENQVDTANQVLKQAEALTSLSVDDLNFSENRQEEKLGELEQLISMNDMLRIELDNTNKQLMAFIQKARLFQAQKEQIKMHKATQNQMHKNFVNLNNDHKQLSRKFKNLEAKNEILSVQLKNSTDDVELLAKLDELRNNLEAKEQIMDRLVIEKEMIEQQFLSINKEADADAEASHALERLQSEHQLLEQQFLEILNELDKNKPELLDEAKTKNE